VALVGVEDQAAVDFVGTDDEIVLFGEGGEVDEFFT